MTQKKKKKAGEKLILTQPWLIFTLIHKRENVNPILPSCCRRVSLFVSRGLNYKSSS